ncbi:MAG TPA: tyrosine--tRNA ligase [Candidatus Paceibacterota bacterium]|jgi:tyrosyl-tRNA synthetase|nr:tyrosine--tRNA ligase [Candidatus Paceibacterota bacterium]
MGFFNKVLGTGVSQSPAQGKLSGLLKERGYVYQHSAPLEEITDGQKRTLYLGIDPSADSLHVGSLVGLLVMRQFLEHGHKVILLTGGGTGMIGDPGGKSEERNLLDEAAVAKNSRAVAAQIRKVFGRSDFIEENNVKWLTSIKLLEFLRDIGKHFTVNSMIKKDTVKTRLDAEAPLSFTEFSYSLLQGYDFLHLNQEYVCDLQVGGSDQWSNILSGVEFIRRKTGKTVYAFTWPLLINKSTGKKFGKSEAGAVWLDPAKTSPFQFYQFWFNAADADVEDYLLKMTLMSKRDIDEVMKEQNANPAARAAQKRLAYEVTALVHGEDEAKRARDFENIPAINTGKLRDVMKDFSTSELRRLVEQGGVSSATSGKIDSIDYEIKTGEEIKIGKSKVYKAK